MFFDKPAELRGAGAGAANDFAATDNCEVNHIDNPTSGQARTQYEIDL